MMNTLNFAKRLWSDDEGATAIEYGLLAALIAVAIIGAVTTLGEGLIGTFGEVSAELAAAPDGGGEVVAEE
ncbi:MAG TPA: Flp family type IVb pilin [Amaricoccus sp.]|uniref:Flp family type IVb pilin n=1 Tax=Amaricoccus sp. TaxID=1872485 RepID=UPI002BA1260F|nr:Flp family type IVb pilin [Amaricoccus sp.]HMQ92304.1 Flp family type IVb pilin [Amaricoccus sp.]HMR52273.1 Flp family type IVb pilin [Amaricoccus sp.]HMR59689.1 Flp family type IVb pilin [Amaricoccus sp.]HMT99194.1 Flp family type IVb pilin [Amaricoccus sp.]